MNMDKEFTSFDQTTPSRAQPSIEKSLKHYFLGLASRISTVRRDLGLTQGEMATMAKTSLSTYRKIETGDSTVTAETLYRVVMILEERSKREILKANENQY